MNGTSWRGTIVALCGPYKRDWVAGLVGEKKTGSILCHIDRKIRAVASIDSRERGCNRVGEKRHALATPGLV